MKRHKPPTQGQQIAPPASELPLWGGENPGVVLIAGAVLIHSHKRSKVTRFIHLQIPQQGSVMSWGKGSTPSQVTR